MQILICGKKKGSLWKAKVLTERNDMFNGSHTMNQWTLWNKFELLQ